MTAAPSIRTSVVIPVYNESESIPQLLAETDAILAAMGAPYEIIVVDDGSTDGTLEELHRLRLSYPHLRLFRLRRNSGQTPALMAGVARSRGEMVVTMDGDLQNDPADISRLIAKVEEGYEIVSGWRRKRRDGWLLRRLPSRVANAILRTITGIPIHDHGCALKAYRGDLLRSVSLYSDFHRFVVPLTQTGGARVAEVATHHRPRRFGRSKYGIARISRVIADMTTLLMITRFSDRLLLWFLLFAAGPLILGFAMLAWTIWIARMPTHQGLLVPIGGCVLMFQTVLVIVSYGFFAERIRHLAPSRRPRGERLLGTLHDAALGTIAPILIRRGEARVLGGRIPSNSLDPIGADEDG